MKKHVFLAFLMALTLALSLLLSSCAVTPSEISVPEKTNDSPAGAETENTVTVNISSQKIHLRADCRHLQRADGDNLRLAEYTEETVNTLLSMGFSFCSECEKSIADDALS